MVRGCVRNFMRKPSEIGIVRLDHVSAELCLKSSLPYQLVQFIYRWVNFAAVR